MAFRWYIKRQIAPGGAGITLPHDHGRFKMLERWLPRIVPELESELPELPSECVDLRLTFQRVQRANYRQRPQVPSFEEINSQTRIEIIPDKRQVRIETDEAFERGLSSPENISERALRSRQSFKAF